MFELEHKEDIINNMQEATEINKQLGLEQSRSQISIKTGDTSIQSKPKVDLSQIQFLKNEYNCEKGKL